MHAARHQFVVSLRRWTFTQPQGVALESRPVSSCACLSLGKLCDHLILDPNSYVGDDAASINAQFVQRGYGRRTGQRQPLNYANDNRRGVKCVTVPSSKKYPPTNRRASNQDNQVSTRFLYGTDFFTIKIEDNAPEPSFDQMLVYRQMIENYEPAISGSKSTLLLPVLKDKWWDEDVASKAVARKSRVLESSSILDSLRMEVDALEAPAGIDNFNSLTDSSPSLILTGRYLMAVTFLACQSPDCIHVRPLAYENKYQELFDALQSTYDISMLSGFLPPAIGVRCAAYVRGKWIRAYVDDVDESSRRLSITDLDCGESHTVLEHHICKLVDPYLSTRDLALKCSLSRVQPVGRTWDDDIGRLITFKLMGADLIYLSFSQRPAAIESNMSAQLIYRHHGRFTNLNDLLLQVNLADVLPVQ